MQVPCILLPRDSADASQLPVNAFPPSGHSRLLHSSDPLLFFAYVPGEISQASCHFPLYLPKDRDLVGVALRSEYAHLLALASYDFEHLCDELLSLPFDHDWQSCASGRGRYLGAVLDTSTDFGNGVIHLAMGWATNVFGIEIAFRDVIFFSNWSHISKCKRVPSRIVHSHSEMFFFYIFRIGRQFPNAFPLRNEFRFSQCFPVHTLRRLHTALDRQTRAYPASPGQILTPSKTADLVPQRTPNHGHSG